MKGRVLVLDRPPERPAAAALMVDGRLQDLILDPPHDRGAMPSVGDIAVVRVRRRMKSAAFCEMPGGDGFLRDAGKVREGELILAQVAALPEPGKAVTLTPRVLHKGPRLILTPGAPGVNVSRRIGNDAERERLTTAVTGSGVVLPEGAGVIVRTSAKRAEARALVAELAQLSGEAKRAAAALSEATGPVTVLHRDAVRLALQEWVTPLPDRIAVASHVAKGFGAGDLWGDLALADRIAAEPDPFEGAGVWDALADLAGAEVDLGDARMTVEATRALVAVDVDTGADTSAAAGLKANIATLRELPRQLRLRGLGGQVTIDAAPVPKPQRRQVEEAAKSAFRDDPVETTVVGWTPLGHLELQRKRERRPLTEVWSP